MSLLQLNIQAIIDRWIEKSLNFDIKDHCDNEALVNTINALNLNEIVMKMVDNLDTVNLVTKQWNDLRTKHRNLKVKFFYEVADELCFEIAKRYFRASSRSESIYNQFRFEGTRSVPELGLKYGNQKIIQVAYAPDELQLLILQLAKQQNYYVLLELEPNMVHNIFYDEILLIEALVIRECLLGKVEFEEWMADYILPPFY